MDEQQYTQAPPDNQQAVAPTVATQPPVMRLEPNQELVQQLVDAKNILVTVSKDPSIDQLAAALGLTIALNALDKKRATAVFSGQVPSVLDFLKPEDTFEQTTDSLRDFIIALDRSKADRLRYKLEDDVVRIYITPYHTAITPEDLEFTQGDFNVDVVVALGIKNQEDIDNAIQAHGRILHDALVVTLSDGDAPELGTVHWIDNRASCLSEMVTALVQTLGENILDSQVATALLTGIVAKTERFSNDRTTPLTMSAGATLMAAGASQQLITSQLEAPVKEPEPSDADESSESARSDEDSTELEIDHAEQDEGEASAENQDDHINENQIKVDDEGNMSKLNDDNDVPLPEVESNGPQVEVKRDRRAEASTYSNPISANLQSDAGGMLTVEPDAPILSHAAPIEPDVELGAPGDTRTLAEIEAEVESRRAEGGDLPNETEARDSVDEAVKNDELKNGSNEPIEALGAQPLADIPHDSEPETEANTEAMTARFVPAPAPPSAFPGDPSKTPAYAGDQAAPPPVPPPMLPPM